MLITAGFLDDYHLPRLVDEALDEDGPEAITASLMGFLEAHTSRVNPAETNGRDMLDYVVRSACRAFHDLAQQRGGDPHEFIRSQLSAASSTVDEYHGVAQTLLATALLPVEHTALFEQTLDVAAPAYGRVSARPSSTSGSQPRSTRSPPRHGVSSSRSLSPVLRSFAALPSTRAASRSRCLRRTGFPWRTLARYHVLTPLQPELRRC